MPIRHQSRAAKRLKYSVEFKCIVRIISCVMQPSYSTEPATDSSDRSLPSRPQPARWPVKAEQSSPRRQHGIVRRVGNALRVITGLRCCETLRLTICGSRQISTGDEERYEARIKVAGAHFPSSLIRHAQTPIDTAAPTNCAG